MIYSFKKGVVNPSFFRLKTFDFVRIHRIKNLRDYIDITMEEAQRSISEFSRKDLQSGIESQDHMFLFLVRVEEVIDRVERRLVVNLGEKGKGMEWLTLPVY